MNKARLLERIAELVRNKKIDGISELRDESDKDGMRVVIELKRGEVAEIVLNNLYAQTPMETVFGINMVALLDGQPRLMSLREMLDAFLRHRREVVTRRTIFELRRARERAHMLEGLAVALANIDEIIALIKASPTPAEARSGDAGAQLAAAASVPRDAASAPARLSTRPDGLAAELGLQRRRLSAERGAGAGDPRHAPAPPHRPRAGQDRRGVPGAAAARSSICRTSWRGRSA